MFVWFALFIIFLIVEVITTGVTAVWFAVAALVSGILAAFGAPVFIQILIFLILSICLFFGFRPIFRDRFNKDRIKTNAESLIGQPGTVIERIDTMKDKGRVRVCGQEWAARTITENGVISEGSVIVVDDIKGVHLIVHQTVEEY